jgi:hypothetical protein
VGSAEVSGGKGSADVGGERALGKSIDICFVSTDNSLSIYALYGRAIIIQKGTTMKFLRRQFLQLAGQQPPLGCFRNSHQRSIIR